MLRALTRASYFCQIGIAALLFATVFATSTIFFQYLVTAKQWRLEQATLLVYPFFVLSFPLFTRIIKHYSRTIMQNTLGDNHKALGDFDKGETAYKKSSNMVPGLLLPKYLLAKLYNESAQTSKAKQAAREILNSPVKVESTATHEIMNEMRNTLTQTQETINTKLAYPLPTPPNPLKGEPQTRNQNSKHGTRNTEPKTRNKKLIN
jgi:hypothetical protein